VHDEHPYAKENRSWQYPGQNIGDDMVGNDTGDLDMVFIEHGDDIRCHHYGRIELTAVG
jgi:hypothetical protein